MMRRRRFQVVHSRDGFLLSVRDEHPLLVPAEWATERLLAVLGHPCCGIGPLARLHVSYRSLWRTGLLRLLGGLDVVGEDGKWQFDPDENTLDLLWFRVMNAPNRLYAYGTWIAEIPLKDDQALRIEPAVAEWDFVWNRDDEDEDEEG